MKSILSCFSEPAPGVEVSDNPETGEVIVTDSETIEDEPKPLLQLRAGLP